MALLEEVVRHLASLMDTAAAVVACGVGLALANYVLLGRKTPVLEEQRVYRQLAMVALVALAIVLVILTLPIGDNARGQLLGLMGLLISAVIALSSTTFVGNAMAGLMLRVVGSFRPGDFVRVGEQFGRVTLLGLLHTEVQTEDRDLTTLPNLYLVTNPVKVVHREGTLVSGTVSLGYDVPRERVEKLMLRAADLANLREAFVHVVELGDYSVVYRVRGFLESVETLITARSRLNGAIMDALHRGGVEIVSPTFMNQRVYATAEQFVPPVQSRPSMSAEDSSAEAIMFDKADEAASREKLKQRLEMVQTRLKHFEAQLAEEQDDETRVRLQVVTDKLRERRDRLVEEVNGR